MKMVSLERRHLNALNDNIFMEFGPVFLVKKPYKASTIHWEVRLANTC